MKRGQPPRIGILVKVFPKLSESFILEEVLGLERRGLPLHIVTLDGPDVNPAHARTRQVRAPLTGLPGGRVKRGCAMLVAQASALLRRPRAWWGALRHARQHHGAGWRKVFTRAVWLSEVCARKHIDHLHVHFASEPSDVAELAQLIGGTPFSVSSHAKDLYCAEPADLRRKLSSARFVATCTSANVHYLTQEIAPATPVHRVYHGIDTALFSPGPRAVVGAAAPLLLAVGRLRPKKGFSTLLRAVHLVHQRGIAVRAAIVGYGPELEVLRWLASELGIAAQIEFTGALTHEALLHWYRRAALFCLPCEVLADGDRDGIPNVMLEAMAMALPVITTPVSGIPEVVTHADNGWLVPPTDPAALADAICQLLADRQTCAEIGLRARATVGRMFDSDRNLAALADLLTGECVDTPSVLQGRTSLAG